MRTPDADNQLITLLHIKPVAHEHTRSSSR